MSNPDIDFFGIKTARPTENVLGLLKPGECMLVTPCQAELTQREATDRSIPIKLTRCLITPTHNRGKYGVQQEMFKLAVIKRGLDEHSYEYINAARRRHVLHGYLYPHLFTKGIYTTPNYRAGITANLLTVNKQSVVDTCLVLIFDYELDSFYNGYLMKVTLK